MTQLDHYLKYERIYAFSAVAVFMFLHTTINATSILMEAHQAGVVIPISQPFITEYTSLVSSLLLLPMIIWFTDRFPFTWGNLRWHVLAHLGFSVVFSVLHIAGFVLLRELVFGLQGVEYKFADNLLLAFVYEYRKDAWGYLLIVIAICSYQFILSRLKGEARPVANGEDPSSEGRPDRFLVKKLGKEFVVNVDDVAWLEAAGNYVNLHSQGRIYPLRTTMSSLTDSLADRGFVRIHRSAAVNVNYVTSLTPLESGDCVVEMKDGQTVNLSRRYRDDFRMKFNPDSAAVQTAS